MRYRLIAVFALVACSTLMADEKLNDVKKKIAERTAKHNSVQQNMKITVDMSQAGMTMKSTTTSKSKYLKKDGKLLSRIESDSKTAITGPMNQTTESKSLTVVDGEYMWTLSDSQGQKTVMKNAIPEEMKSPFDPGNAWEHFDVKVVDDDTVDGMKCWVLEMTPKDPMMKMQMSKALSYFDQKTGLMVKNVGYNSEGKVFSTMTVSDIKVDEKIDPKEFKFEPPAGVPVQEGSKIPGMGG